MATPNLLRITEKWVKERVQYDSDNLEDIKVLSLPGNYKEKITHLGTSLLHFSRLKELDLSRNAIVSLDGLEHLHCLAVLNLYFNQITTLEEVYKLRANAQLQSLDMRLNPLGRNEPDYRLFLVHMLPCLSRLDDRPVLDDERRAALMNFSSDTAKEFQPFSGDTQIQRITSRPARSCSLSEEEAGADQDAQPVSSRRSHPRVQQVERWRPLAYNKRPHQADLGDAGPAESSSSPWSSPTSRSQRGSKVYQDVAERFAAEKTFSVSSPAHAPPPHGANNCGDSLSLNCTFTSSKKVGQKVHFASEGGQQNPQSEDSVCPSSPLSTPSSSRVPMVNLSLSARGLPPVLAGDKSICDMNGSVSTNWEENAAMRLCLMELCDLVDRYWNGRRSLHSHPKFIPTAVSVLQEYLNLRNSDSNHSKPAAGASTQSRQHPQQQQQNVSSARSYSVEDSPYEMSRTETKKGKGQHLRVKDPQLVERLQNELSEMKNENKKLLQEVEKTSTETRESKRAVDKAALSAYSKEEFDHMRQELNAVRVKLRALEQVSDMAQMLKESHKSLVTTNQQLMNELRDVRMNMNNNHTDASSTATPKTYLPGPSSSITASHQTRPQYIDCLDDKQYPSTSFLFNTSISPSPV